jgi:hypothetical protein
MEFLTASGNPHGQSSVAYGDSSFQKEHSGEDGDHIPSFARVLLLKEGGICAANDG